MVTIGKFIDKDGAAHWEDSDPLSISASLVFVPNENPSRPDAPAYRLFAGPERGAAWEKGQN